MTATLYPSSQGTVRRDHFPVAVAERTLGEPQSDYSNVGYRWEQTPDSNKQGDSCAENRQEKGYYDVTNPPTAGPHDRAALGAHHVSALRCLVRASSWPVEQ
jgi:hypothetical protein